MKTPQMSLWALLLAGVVLPGCNDHQETRTTVYENGTCERKIVVDNDDAKTWPTRPFPLPSMGSRWDTSRIAPDTSHHGVRWCYAKTFPSFDALQQEYAHSGDSSHFAVRVSLEKRFRWFYTYYDYQETYGRFTVDTLVDPRSVLSADDIHRYSMGDTDAVVGKKVEEWKDRNVFEVFFRRLTRDAEFSHGDTALAQDLRRGKEKFFQLFANDRNADSLRMHSSYRGTAAKMFNDEKGVTPEGVQALVEVGREIAGTSRFDILRPSIEPAVHEMIDFIMQDPTGKGDAGDFVNVLVLPGILISTNASSVKGAETEWHIGLHQLQLQEYIMSAESRTVNVWAFVISGLVGVALLGWLAISAGGKLGRRRIV